MSEIRMRFLLAGFFCVLLSGCTTVLKDRLPSEPPPGGSAVRIKPVVAVMDFENKADFKGQWKLGSGMAEVLIGELLDTELFTVLERKHLDNVVGEIIRQGQGLFREEGRVETGRLKNAQYVIRGVITDFTVTGDVSGWFGTSGAVVKGGGSRARVALTINVSDVETGEIIASVKSERSVGAGWFGGAVNYRKLAFGGDAFFRTPLGKATESAIARAVKRVVKELPVAYWQPHVAEAGPDTVIINGGRNVKLRIGDKLAVREEGRDITDPLTGNVIENVPGRVIGQVEIYEVKPLSAHAVIIEGEARRGLQLEFIESANGVSEDRR